MTTLFCTLLKTLSTSLLTNKDYTTLNILKTIHSSLWNTKDKTSSNVFENTFFKFVDEQKVNLTENISLKLVLWNRLKFLNIVGSTSVKIVD